MILHRICIVHRIAKLIHKELEILILRRQKEAQILQDFITVVIMERKHQVILFQRELKSI